jgi:hypothetical protein
MSGIPRDPEVGRILAAKLRELGVKGVLIKAAEQGYITQLECKMPECFCPEELGGPSYFEPVAAKSDWSPTHEHFPLSKREGGHRVVDNAILAHRLCNRIDYSITVGRGHARDLERIRRARDDAIRLKNENLWVPSSRFADDRQPQPKRYGLGQGIKRFLATPGAALPRLSRFVPSISSAAAR